MIVVDSNIIAYLLITNPVNPFTKDVEALLDKDADWAVPVLWRSELRNILATYLRKQLMSLETAIQIQAYAETMLGQNEYQISSTQVLELAATSGCSAYDCEFVALAKSLKLPLITTDKKILSTFPDIAITAKEYLAK